MGCLQLLSKRVQGGANVQLRLSLGLEPCTQELEAQRWLGLGLGLGLEAERMAELDISPTLDMLAQELQASHS